jgi:hypothetical protein
MERASRSNGIFRPASTAGAGDVGIGYARPLRDALGPGPIAGRRATELCLFGPAVSIDERTDRSERVDPLLHGRSESV